MTFSPLKRVTIPANGFHWLIEVSIDAVSFLLVLDTGASRTTFDLNTVNACFPSLVVQETDEKSASVGAVNLDSALCIFPELFFENQVFQNCSIALLDLSHVKSAYAQLDLPDVLGVLGADLLVKGNASVDCAKNWVKWRKRN